MALEKLDVVGAKCPIPIVKAKKEMDTMGWMKTAKHALKHLYIHGLERT